MEAVRGIALIATAIIALIIWACLANSNTKGE